MKEPMTLSPSFPHQQLKLSNHMFQQKQVSQVYREIPEKREREEKSFRSLIQCQYSSFLLLLLLLKNIYIFFFL